MRVRHCLMQGATAIGAPVLVVDVGALLEQLQGEEQEREEC